MAPASAKARLLVKNDNDVVIVAAVRSALTKVWVQNHHSHTRTGLTYLNYRAGKVVLKILEERRSCLAF